MHPAFISDARASVTWREISQFPILLPAPQTAMRRVVDGVLAENGIETQNRYQFIQAETIMAEARLGVAIQPATRLEKLPGTQARVMALTEPSIRRAMSLMTLRNAPLTPAARHLAGDIVRTVRAVTGYSPDAETFVA